MTVIEDIIRNSPNWIDWDAPILQALVGKKNFTKNAEIKQSGDYNCGAVANELEFFYASLKKEAKNRDFSKSRSDLLEHFASIIVGEKRLLNENDISYIKRLSAVCEMGGVETRTTKEALTAFLSYFYPWVSIMEGLENEPGISESFDSWTLNNCNMKMEKKSFTGNVLQMTATSYAENTFTELTDGYREICFFMKSENIGKCGSVTINDEVFELSCNSNKWQQQKFLVKTKSETVNIKIEATTDILVDYFHLFKEESPCFTVLLHKNTSILDVADDEAIISREPLVVDDTTNYTAKGKVENANWNYFLRTDSLTEQNETWVLQKLNKLKGKGVKHKVVEVKI